MRTPFDRTKAIKAAWEALWAERLAERERNKGTVWATGRWGASTTYITASDLERRVRTYAEETVAGKPWGSTGPYGPELGGRVRIPGNLFGDVRDWLLREVSAGRLASHNFGRGHISGMRFRPAGEPVSDIEKKTIEAKERRKGRPRPVHYTKSGHFGGPLLCMAGRKRVGWGRSKSHSTGNRERVTCPRCLKLLAEEKAA